MESKFKKEPPPSEGRLHDLIDHEFRKSKHEFGHERPMVDESGKINNAGRETALRIFTELFGDSSDLLYAPIMLQCATLERQFRNNNDQKSQTLVALARSIRSRIVCSATADFVAQNQELLPQNATLGLELLETESGSAKPVEESEKKQNFRGLFKQRREILEIIAESRAQQLKQTENLGNQRDKKPAFVENFYDLVDRQKDELRMRLRDERLGIEKANIDVIAADMQVLESTDETNQNENRGDKSKWLLKLEKITNKVKKILTPKNISRTFVFTAALTTFLCLGLTAFQSAKASSYHEPGQLASNQTSHFINRQASSHVQYSSNQTEELSIAGLDSVVNTTFTTDSQNELDSNSETTDLTNVTNIPAQESVLAAPKATDKLSNTGDLNTKVAFSDYHPFDKTYEMINGRTEPKLIVIHYADHTNFQTGEPLPPEKWTPQSIWNGLSSRPSDAHFAIGGDGTVWQMLPMYEEKVQMSRGAAGLSDKAINIEMGGNDEYFKRLDVPTIETKKTIDLTIQLMIQYDLKFADVVGHYEMNEETGNAKPDPTPEYMAYFKSQLAQELTNRGLDMGQPTTEPDL